MARSPRLNFPDGVYHVTSRGNGRARIVYNDDDRERFERQLRDNVQTYGILLYAWVLMDNHFHLLVRTPRANLSQFMQRLNTSYALYARYKHGRPGHQFEARFKAKVVEEESYLLAVTRYIHLNPIKIAACRRLTKAERVQRLEGYRWSSYPGYVAKRNSQEFVCYDVLREYGATFGAARRRYRAYVHACVTEDDEPLLEAMRASRHAIGEASFVEETEQRLGELRTGRVQDKDLALPVVTVAFDTVDRCVAERYGIDPEQLKQHGRRVGVAKAVAVELSCMLTGENARTVGLHYGGISCSAVGNIRRKVREGQLDIRSDLDPLLSRIRTTHVRNTANGPKV
ncbi:MAG: transposase [Patescibacteria group bacterium]|nr:transposase [Patescibacteria group bacterium]